MGKISRHFIEIDGISERCSGVYELNLNVGKTDLRIYAHHGDVKFRERDDGASLAL